jgi:cell division protein FtsA
MQSHKPKSKGSLLAALDIGSSKVACFIGRVTDEAGGLEILGVGHQVSEGVKNGAITDLAAAEAVIRRTVHAAENMAADVMKGYPLREVVVNLPGVHAGSILHKAEVNISGHPVTDNDIRRALVKAQEEAFQQVPEDGGFELIHTIPVSYRIDGHQGITEPRGMVGHSLGVDIHMTSGDILALRNIASCVERSHLDISAFCTSAYAAGLASLVDDEMELGCTVIDIGGGVTSFAVFHNRNLLYADAVPIGGKHVTGDIAKGLTTALVDAERIKVLYGSAMAGGLDETEMIDVPKLGEDAYAPPNHVQRSLLVGIIQPRLEEIFELVRSRLQDAGLGNAVGRRVVLTGGASLMPGMRELANYVMDKQVRVGRSIRLTGLPDAVSGPAFATTAGLLTYLAERSDEMPADIVAQVTPGTLWERVKFWMRENW